MSIIRYYEKKIQEQMQEAAKIYEELEQLKMADEKLEEARMWFQLGQAFEHMNEELGTELKRTAITKLLEKANGKS